MIIVRVLIFILLLCSHIVIDLFLKDETYMYANSELYPDNQTLTISLSDVKQIPWATVDTYTYELETFGAAVFGLLTETDESEIKNTSTNDILLEDYICQGNICYAKLKKGIYFHNGREVNAYDVEFSYLKDLLKFKNNSFSYSMLENIMGVKEFYEEKKPVKFWKCVDGLNYPSGYITGIEVTDKYNFILHLNHPNKFIFQTLSTAFLPIVPIEELKDNYTDWKKFPVGFGRYKVIDADFDHYEFVLKKVNVHDILTKYIRIIFGSHKPSDMRLTSQNAQFDKTTQDVIVFSGIYSNAGFLFNFKTQLGRDENFRKAINLALDRNKICARVQFSEITPENQLLPNYGWQKIYRADLPLTAQNVEEAQKYLNMVPNHLWKDKTLNIHTFWTTHDEPESVAYFKEIKEQLLKIGLNIKFHKTDMNYTKFRENDENVLWWTGFDLQTEQPNANFSYFQKGSFFNNIYPEDPEFELLYRLSVKNLHKSHEDTKNLSMYFTQKSIMVVVFNLRNAFIYKKERIKSFGLQPSGVRLKLTELKMYEN